MLPDLSADQLLHRLESAIAIRRFEEALIKLARDRDIGHFHVYVGQEMTGVFALQLLEKGDLTFTTHRNHGHILARGAEAKRAFEPGVRRVYPPVLSSRASTQCAAE